MAVTAVRGADRSRRGDRDDGPEQATRIRVSPIMDADLPRIGRFLHAHLNRGVSADQWARSLDVPWRVERPNSGFMLLAGDTVVGAHLAFYSERVFDGRAVPHCNLAAWCVLPEYRFHGLRLLKALLAQEGYQFTDLSPSGSVVGINARLGFKFLDTATWSVPTLPWPSRPGRDVISSDPAVIERTLTGRDLQLYRDHAGARAARHLLLARDREWCYVVFRKDRRKRLRLFASVLHVSNPKLFRAMSRPFGRHLLLHHGVMATLAEERIVKYRPRPSFSLRSPRRKMFRGPDLEAARVDYLYSELVCVPW